MRTLAEITRRQQAAAPPDLDLIDNLPMTAVNITLLPEAQQRSLYDAFHLEVRYDLPSHAVILRVTIDAETAPALANAAKSIVQPPKPSADPQTEKAGAGASSVPAPVQIGWDVLGAPGRTHKASATISDLRKHAPVEIECRYRLPAK
jgi:site-specific DNA recombinase